MNLPIELFRREQLFHHAAIGGTVVLLVGGEFVNAELLAWPCGKIPKRANVCRVRFANRRVRTVPRTSVVAVVDACQVAS